MKVLQIIQTVAKLLQLNNIPSFCFDEQTDPQQIESELRSNKTLATLLDSINYVLDDIAIDYSPNIAKGEIFCTKGFACTKMLDKPLLEVLKLTNSTGQNVKFRYVVGGLHCNCDGKLFLTYTTRYPVVGIFDQVEISNKKIDERVMAFGVAAEYCLLTSDYESMTVWDNRFKNCLASSLVKKPEKKLPARRWC